MVTTSFSGLVFIRVIIELVFAAFDPTSLSTCVYSVWVGRGRVVTTSFSGLVFIHVIIEFVFAGGGWSLLLSVDWSLFM